MTRLKIEPFGKIQYMKKIIRRIATVAAAGLAPLAFVTVISPAVSPRTVPLAQNGGIRSPTCAVRPVPL